MNYLDQNVPVERLAAAFQQFAAFQSKGHSPLYERLCRGIAQDEALLRLAAHSPRAQPLPNVLLGAVHYLLLKGTPHALAAYYADLSPDPLPPDTPFPLFRAFCQEHQAEIKALLAARRVQTNEVGRCALLLPVFGVIAQRPLALVEVGTSAGLNLLWDRYRYQYSDGQRCGSAQALVRGARAKSADSVVFPGGRVARPPGLKPARSARCRHDAVAARAGVARGQDVIKNRALKRS
ncbi:MAG: DUF2332 domain-containing protein [Chloroflexi bacterium]|nr:DUF2332 domain-containing protein [Chloroflexota bacterium]